MKKWAFFLIFISLFLNSCNDQKETINNLDKEIFEELDSISLDMENKVNGAIEVAQRAGSKAQEIFNNKKKYGEAVLNKDIYYRSKTGVLSDHAHKTESNVNIYSHVSENNFIKWYVKATEDMIKVWKENGEHYPYIGWQYVLDTKYNALRIFPWIETTSSFSPNIHWPKMGFYKCVNPQNDPEKKLKWCDHIGTDILGLGLISSVSMPIYVNNKFVAVSAIDFLITKTFKKYLYKEYPGMNSYLMLIDRKSTQVILRNEKNNGDRGWDFLFNYAYIDKYAKMKPGNEVVINKILSEDKGIVKVNVPNDKKIYFKRLKNVDWIVAIVTETSK